MEAERLSMVLALIVLSLQIHWNRKEFKKRNYRIAVGFAILCGLLTAILYLDEIILLAHYVQSCLR